jgi:peptidoglycan/LPS O-acetylase OafA/YrhL
VLPVVLFHAGVPGFGGGFVGVDVFFVISGFLITQVLIHAGAAPARATLARFYLRRARRILPALVVMLAVVALAALVLLLPTDLRRFGMFLAFASAFLGNLAAWLGGGYFDTAGASLLHLWSIGIEEQFYLLYPLVFLWWSRRSARTAAMLLAIAAAASLALCAWASFAHPVANFYSPPTRAWELLGGAALARSGWSGFASRTANHWAAALALGALVACIPLFRDDLHHPGLVTVVPCAATALLLGTGARAGTFASALLRWRPLVFTGLISYSLYLWHAPILSLLRYYLIQPPTALLLALALAAIYAIATASWYWVERPLRGGTRIPSSRRFVWTFALASACLSALGAWMVVRDGLPGRFDAQVQRLSFRYRSFGPEANHCITLPDSVVARGGLCEFGSGNPARPAVVVWGDSHAMALLPAYRRLASQYDLRLFLAARSACRPLFADDPRHPFGKESCRRFNEAMLSAVREIEPAVVVMNAFWNLPEFLPDAPGGDATLLGDFARAGEAAARRAAAGGARVCVVLGVPQLSQVLPYALGMAHRRGLSTDFMHLDRTAAGAQNAKVDGVFRALERRHLLELVDPKAVLCAGGDCRLLSDDGLPLYNDTNHLSKSGAMLLGPRLARCIVRNPP